MRASIEEKPYFPQLMTEIIIFEARAMDEWK
jgi:hypothetical protein